MAETPSGILNAVGLQNKGVDYFIDHIYPTIKDIDTHFMVNVSGSSPETYAECAAKLDALDKIPAIEVNISCPDVKQGEWLLVWLAAALLLLWRPFAGFIQDDDRQAFAKRYRYYGVAQAVEARRIDAVSLINTLLGMAIDAERKPLLSTITGGLSGPCVWNRLLWGWFGKHIEQFRFLSLDWAESLQLKMPLNLCWQGASAAVEIGTYNFIDPCIGLKVIDGIDAYCDRHGFHSVTELVGALEK